MITWTQNINDRQKKSIGDFSGEKFVTYKSDSHLDYLRIEEDPVTLPVMEDFACSENPSDIFVTLANICQNNDCDMSDIITVVIDEQNVIGKKFKILSDGIINKNSVVSISRGIACQFNVPNHATLQNVLTIVGDNPHAAIINSGWKHAKIGEKFVFLSQKKIIGMGLDHEAVTNVNGMRAFARLKVHASPSTWQLLDRDEDKFTPEWAVKQSFSEWLANLDKILPGVAKVKMLRAKSSSARVIRSDGSPDAVGNGHVWIRVKDAADAERTRTAIMARALENNLAWPKPRFSKTTGNECGQGFSAIVDPSVWTTGRLIFVGRPTCSHNLKVIAQQFEMIEGEDDALDTAKADISALKTFRASAKHGVPLRLLRNDNRGYRAVMLNLRMETEIELEDGSVKIVRDLIENFKGKLRCQSPFRASHSMAAFFSINRNGEPFVFDSGTDTTHRLLDTVNRKKVDKDCERLIREVKYRLGQLIGDHNVDVVLNEDVLRKAWDSTFFSPTCNKVKVINANDELIDLSDADFKKFGFRKTFGNIFYDDFLKEIIAEMKLTEEELDILDKKIGLVKHQPFCESIKLSKQAKSLDMAVDIFAKHGILSVANGIATIALPHHPFAPKLIIELNVIKQVFDDFVQHFPEFPIFLDLILHARFATDRRHAFVWLHSSSSWGKGFLLAIFEQLGLVVNVSSSEIEKALAGGPVGLSLTDTLRSWILFVDEFKAASSELKLLNTRISIAPKNQLRCTVQLYTKLFASTEKVQSLVGVGVEAQFNNRFAYLSPTTNDKKLEHRQLFNDIGKVVYLNAMVNYVSNYLNNGVDRLRAMGQIESSKLADKFIETYQAEHRLDMTFCNLTDAVDDIVVGIKQCLIEYANWHNSNNLNQPLPEVVQGIGQTLLNTLRRNAVLGYVSEGDGSKQRHNAILLGDSAAFIKQYIALSLDRSTIAKMQHKCDEIAMKLHMRTEACTGRVRVYESAGESSVKASKRGVVVFLSHIPDAFINSGKV